MSQVTTAVKVGSMWQPVPVGKAELERALVERMLRDVDVEVLARGMAVLCAEPHHPNHRHAGRAVLEAARLQSVGNWVQAQARKKLDQLRAGLLSELGRSDPTQGKEHLDKFLSAVKKRVGNAYSALLSEVRGYMARLQSIVAKRSGRRVAEHYRVHVQGYDQSPVDDTLVVGAPLPEHFAKMASDLVFKIGAAARTGVAAGDSLDGLAKRMFGGKAEIVAVKASSEIGHPFYGNQWTSGAAFGAAKAASEKAREVSSNAVGHRKLTAAANAHYSAARAHMDAADEAKKQDDLAAMRFHMDAASTHMKIASEHKQMAALDRSVKQVEKLYDRGRISQEERDVRIGKIGSGVKATSFDDVRGALQVAVDLLDSADGSLNKVIQAAVQAFAREGVSSLAEGLAEAEKEMGWQWVAVGDGRTCERCEFYDGNRWTAEFEPVGDGPEFPEEPPIHFSCRCAIVPSDLDGPASEMDFDGYLAQMSRSEQERAFGKEALRAYRRGDITSSQLVGQKENLMSLDEFEEGE